MSIPPLLPRLRTALLALLMPLLLVALVACGGGGNASPLTSITVTPYAATPFAGQSLQMSAVGYYQDGHTSDLSASVQWASSATSRATISGQGLLSALSTGAVTVTATAGSIVGSVDLTVLPRQATETILHRFGSVANDGLQPGSPLIQGRDGNFYGTTRAGGGHRCFDEDDFCGTVFKATPDGQVTILHAFGATATDGWWPGGALLQLADGSLYGTTNEGGDHGQGTVFRIAADGSYSVLYSFGAVDGDGATPSGALILAQDGNLYGTTSNGGNLCLGGFVDCGTVYRVSLAGDESVVYAFGASETDGFQPNGPLLQASDGTLYGTTTSGGGTACGTHVDECGTVFKITPAGVYSTLYAFGASLDDGGAPQGALIEGRDGNLYGTTASGGAYYGGNGVGNGTLFRITPAGVESVVARFGTSQFDGFGPTPFLVQAQDGNFYGTTYTGGTYDHGSFYRVTPGGDEAILYSFGAASGDAEEPTTSVIQAADGSFYGVSQLGGPSGVGILYRLALP